MDNAIYIGGRFAPGELLNAAVSGPYSDWWGSWEQLAPDGSWFDPGYSHSYQFWVPEDAAGATFRFSQWISGALVSSDPITITADSHRNSAPDLTFTFGSAPFAYPHVQGGTYQIFNSWNMYSDADRGTRKGTSVTVTSTNSLANGGAGDDIITFAGTGASFAISGASDLVYTSAPGAKPYVVGKVDTAQNGSQGKDLSLTFNARADDQVVNDLLHSLVLKDGPSVINSVPRLLNVVIADEHGASVGYTYGFSPDNTFVISLAGVQETAGP